MPATGQILTTMMRQLRKQTLTIALCVQLTLASGWVAPSFADGLTPQMVTDPLTGVALSGYDAISYFAADGPVEGKPDYEYDWNGVPWYFANAADRDIFSRSPEVYAPQFGGHGAQSLAQGYLSDGNPVIYAVLAQRLYLFYSDDNRTAFMATPGASIDNARRNWRKFFPPAPQPSPPAAASPPAATPAPKAP
ncbi:MAG TPA: YHS domain-containing (seleno)protein [Devosiaceae bacterium]|nr:YHS domain-containing (seleno)protein [Devosiaceae bacterium]